MKCLLLLFSVISIFAGIKTIDAQQTTKWGDQGNGTFRNTVLPIDFSDPDVIRVGDDYYGISLTLQKSPRIVIFHSKDLVNWEIIGHVVDDISVLSPELNWNSMKGYDQGVYAGNLRFHNNKFCCHFSGQFLSVLSMKCVNNWPEISKNLDLALNVYKP